MSITIRRGDRGLGQTPAGGTAGSFAAHEREGASPPLAMLVRSEVERQMQEAREAINTARKEHARATITYAAARIACVDPEAHTLVLGVLASDGKRQLYFSHVADRSGDERFLCDENLEGELMNLFIDERLDADWFHAKTTDRNWDSVVEFPLKEVLKQK